MTSGNPVLIPVPTDVDGPTVILFLWGFCDCVKQWLAIENGSYKVKNRAPLCYGGGGKKKAPCCFSACTKRANHSAEAESSLLLLYMY